MVLMIMIIITTLLTTMAGPQCEEQHDRLQQDGRRLPPALPRGTAAGPGLEADNEGLGFRV